MFPVCSICLVIKLGENVFDRFAVVIVWIYAHLFTVGGAYNGAAPTTQTSCRTDRAGIVGAAPWIRVPCPFRWGAPSFDAGEAFAMPMMMASFFLLLLLSQPVVLFAVSRYASATMLPPSVLSRGVGWQGVAILISGLFGTGAGSSVSISVVQIAAGFKENTLQSKPMVLSTHALVGLLLGQHIAQEKIVR
ncbi:hypothetical protein F2Q68_00022374 [Brassica cretica]|uniref:Uncharacterized protein n=1 Tax=Brassica cretica TaxID=69181 RepID=A0A8S9FTM4_BRACR|nr:hypothetical protein F2Q68_00022374 [Brassica cretica]